MILVKIGTMMLDMHVLTTLFITRFDITTKLTMAKVQMEEELTSR